MSVIARVLAWVMVGSVIFLTLAPPVYRPDTGVERHLEHFLAFALVGLMFALGYPGRRTATALVSIVAVALLETLQLWVPGRHALISDFAVNAAGLCFGLFAAAALQWVARRGQARA